MTDPLVQIAGLRLGFDTGAGRLEVLRGIDLDIAPGEVLALVGESGSGKSALGRSILNLHAPPFVPDRAHMAGSIRLRGEEVLGAGPERLRRLRATDAALISQDALSGLNPVVRVAGQVAEAARAARGQTQRRARPLARRRARTLRPSAVFIRARKPWSRLRFRLLGWYVRLVAMAAPR